MDRIDVANAFWAMLDFTIAGISGFLATHEAGEPWHILHWILAIVFLILFATSAWLLIDDLRSARSFHRSRFKA